MEARWPAGEAELDGLVSPAALTKSMVNTKPWYIWPVLIAAVVAVSSAATAFKAMEDVPPMTLAAWRLQLTSAAVLPMACVEIWYMPPELRRRLWQTAWLLVASGTCLAIHFGCWVTSLERTSLTHALLCASVESLAIAFGTWVLCKPICIGELLGTASGFAGTAILAFDARNDHEVTVVGDAFGLAAAVAAIGYLMVGKMLRKWMPIFAYSLFVTGWAAFLLTAGAALIEAAPVLGRYGLLGWAGHGHLLGCVYLAIVPGIVGHMGINMVLRWLAPLLITLSVATEPLIGSVIGWAAGLASIPGAFTFLGGAILLASVAWVTVAGHRREAAAAMDAGRLKGMQLFQGVAATPLPPAAGLPLPVILELGESTASDGVEEDANSCAPESLSY